MKKNFLCSLLTLTTCLTLTNATLANTQTKEKVALIAVGENLNQSPKIPVTQAPINSSIKLNNPITDKLLTAKNTFKNHGIASLNKLKSLLPELKKQLISPKGIGCTAATILYLFFSYRQGTAYFWKWKSAGYIKLEKEKEALFDEKSTLTETIKKLTTEKENLEKLGANLNAQNIQKLTKRIEKLEELDSEKKIKDENENLELNKKE